MKKIVLSMAVAVMATSAVNAQDVATVSNVAANDVVSMHMNDVIEVLFLNFGTATNGNLNLSNAGTVGEGVTMDFANAAAYDGGIVSDNILPAPSELRVRSTKKWNLTANTTTSTFTGANGGDQTMPVAGVLSVKLFSNQTQGTIAAGYGNTSYGGISITPTTILTGGAYGLNETSQTTEDLSRRVAIQYKANPGWTHPGGTYTVDVVYTATQQ